MSLSYSVQNISNVAAIVDAATVLQETVEQGIMGYVSFVPPTERAFPHAGPVVPEGGTHCSRTSVPYQTQQILEGSSLFFAFC